MYGCVCLCYVYVLLRYVIGAYKMNSLIGTFEILSVKTEQHDWGDWAWQQPTLLHCRKPNMLYILLRFEVITAVTMNSGVFWDVTPCGSCNNRRFGGT
jgi:hypothetical protein